MTTDNARIGLIGLDSTARASFDDWGRTHAFASSSFPLDPPPEVVKLRPFDALVVGADGHPLLALAECARLRSTFTDLPVALLGPRGSELEAAAERAGALFMHHRAADQAPWIQLAALVAARRHALRAAGQAWISAHLCVDRTARVLYVDGEKRSLTAAKFDLFCYLVDNAGRAVSARELVQRGLLLPSQASRYKGLIAELRQHLGIERDCIRAVPGYGYRVDLGERAARSQKHRTELVLLTNTNPLGAQNSA